MKKACITIICILMLLLGISCSNDSRESGTGLEIYVMSTDMSLTQAVNKYNTDNRRQPIEKKEFYQDQRAEYAQKLKAGLAAGDGPDIIVGEVSDFADLSKYMDKCVFADLDPLIKKDKEFEMSDYYENVLEYGIYKGKRYFIPLDFHIDTYLTTKEALRENGLGEGLMDTLQGLDRAAEEYGQKNGGKGKYLFSGASFNLLVQNQLGDFVDMDGKKAGFDAPEFIELLDTYKDIYPSVYPKEKLDKVTSQAELSGLLKSGEVAMLYSWTGNPRYILPYYSAYNGKATPSLYAVPEGNEGGTAAKPFRFAAISSKCSDMETAYGFIKLLLSDEFQGGDTSMGIPVNKKAYASMKKALLNGKGADSGRLPPETEKALLSQLDEVVASVKGGMLIDGEIYSIIDEGMSDFLIGRVSAEDLAKKLQEKVSEYFGKELAVPVEQASDEEKASEPSKVLNLEYMSYQKNISNAVREFRNSHPEVEVVSKVTESIDEFKSKLATELMSGEGPDVIVFTNKYFDSVYKTVQGGVFTDLNRLIEKDAGFNMDAYRREIMDDCLYKGKRMFLPLSYNFYNFCTTKSILEKNNLYIDPSHWTWESLKDMVKEYMKSNSSSGKYFFDSGFTFMSMLSNFEGRLVDYENKKSNFNSQEFIDMLNIYKDIYPAIAINEITDKYGLPTIMLKNGAAVFELTNGLGSPEQLFSANSEYMQMLEEEIRVYPMPTYKVGGRLSSVVGDCAAINEKCADKETAFLFIKTLVSGNMQRSMDAAGNINAVTDAPINKKAYKDDVDKYVTYVSDPFGGDIMSKAIFSEGKLQKSYRIKAVLLPRSVANEMDVIISKINNTMVSDNTISAIINEAAAEFIKGRKTAEQTAEGIQEKVDLFLNE